MAHQFDWTSINHDAFEDLALEYVKDIFPLDGGEWTGTPKSNDGNKDGEGLIRHKLGSEITESLFWCEAKYIRNVDSNLKKCRLDQTLVSAFFEPSLRRIIFVTNGYFAESSKLRALSFSAQARLDKPLFIDEPRVAEWLTRREDVVKRYKLVIKGETRTDDMKIVNVRALLKRDFRKGIWAPVRRLAAGDDYTLFMSIKSNIRAACMIHFEFPAHPALQMALELSVGDNIVTCDLNPEEEVEAQPIEVTVSRNGDTPSIHHLSLPVTVFVDDRFDIVCKSQSDSIRAIREILQKSNTGSSNGLLYIHGPGGAGKSRALDEIAADMEDKLDVEIFEFDGKKGDDSETLVNLVQYLNYGYIYKELNNIAPSPGYYYKELLELFRSGSSLIRNKGAIGEQKVAIVDDLHKATSDISTLLKQLLDEHKETNNNTILLTAARCGEYLDKDLETKIEDLASKTMSISLLTKDDIDRSIELNFPKVHYFQLCDSVSNLTSTIHDLESFFYALAKQLKQTTSPIDIPLLYSQSLGERAFFSSYGEMSQDERLMIDFMYIAERGIELDFVLTHFKEEELDSLIGKKFLKLTTTSGERFVRYWHDIKLEYYKRAPHWHDMDRLMSLIDAYVSNKEEARIDFFHFLIKHHPPTRLRRIHDAIELKDASISIGDFGKAATISRTLVELLCENDGYMKYGIPYDTVLKTKHDHAMCLAHGRSSEEAKTLYQSLRDDRKADLSSDVTIGVVNRAQSELFNVMLREFMPEELIRQALVYTKENHVHMYGEKGELYRRPVLDSYNRLMMALFLSDEYDQAEEMFDKGATLCAKMDRTKDLAGFYLDKARALLHAFPGKSIDLILQAIKLYEVTNESKRRMLVAQSELAYARVLAGDITLADLEKTGQDMLEAKYYRGYVRVRYKCIAHHMVVGNYELCNEDMKTCSHPALTDHSERFRFVRNHLYSVFFAKTGNHSQAIVHARKHLALVKGIGSSYLAVAKNNLEMIKSMVDAPVRWSHEDGVAPSYIIDNRIW